MFASKVYKAHLVSFCRVYRRKHQAFKITQVSQGHWSAPSQTCHDTPGVLTIGEFEDIYRSRPICILFWKQPPGEYMNADHIEKEVYRTFLRTAAASLITVLGSNLGSLTSKAAKHSGQSTRQQSNLVLRNCHHQILHRPTTQLIRLLRWR